MRKGHKDRMKAHIGTSRCTHRHGTVIGKQTNRQKTQSVEKWGRETLGHDNQGGSKAGENKRIPTHYAHFTNQK